MLHIKDKIRTLSKRIGDKPVGPSTGFLRLDCATRGFLPCKLFIIGARQGCGKEQPVDSLVMVEDGQKTIGQLVIGDRVFGANGKLTTVIDIIPQGKKSVFKITMSDGSVAYSGREHLWAIQKDRARIKTEILPLKELTKIKTNRGRTYSIQRHLPLNHAPQKLLLHPYLLGFLLGNGNLSSDHSISISQKNANKIKYLEDFLPSEDCFSFPTKNNTWRIKRKSSKYLGFGKAQPSETKLKLRQLGLEGKYSYNKFIPKIYIYSSIYQRECLLQGLLDTDGYKKSNSKFEYSTTSKHLAKDIKILVNTLGGSCSITNKNNTHYVKNGIKHNTRAAYRLYINLKPPKHYIDKIEYVGEKECKCITVDNKDGLYITDDFIVTHNSSLMVDMAFSAAKTVPVGIFSIEMPEAELLERMSCNYVDLNYNKLTSNKGTKEEIELLDKSAEIVSELPIYYDDGPGYIGVNDWFFQQKKIPLEKSITSKITKWAEQGIKVFFIDHLHRMTWVGKETDKKLQMGETSRILADYAKKLEVCIVLLCQLRRFNPSDFKRKKGEPVIPEPKTEDLKESGDIENNAHGVILIHRPQLYQYDEELGLFEYNSTVETDAKLILAKMRHGPTGKVSVDFHNYSMSFWDKDKPKQTNLFAESRTEVEI